LARIGQHADHQSPDKLSGGITDHAEHRAGAYTIEIGAELEDVIADQSVDRARFNPSRRFPDAVDRQSKRRVFDPEGEGLATAYTIEFIGRCLVGE
jgi:hypothetical protein